jgi:hypothetical protein
MGAEKMKKVTWSSKRPNCWRVRTNDELQVMCGKQNPVTTIKLRRLEWAGYLVRMSAERTVSKYFWGKKKARGPMLRWLDCIENYMYGCPEMEE